MGESHLKDLFNLNIGAGLNGPQAQEKQDSITKGEKPLRIVDHISKHIYSDEKEQTLLVKGDQ